ncbi:hypothetical protein FISHEDRAFT_73055 [Fistulina hepatica ATCC 64428]|uniref:Uncharacterized protein n=1 Tax=Fistulina hepatica ATCC 64428 TaxID=1128425 RepID=A0A0D7AF25_9AGAR|nr:hypothetical protein FISHEDRAFT_73055 [Fistulina hepatica ATCC 64428]
MEQDDNQPQDTSGRDPDQQNRDADQQNQDPNATQQHQACARPPVNDTFFVQYIHNQEEITYEQTPLDYRLKFNKRMERRNTEQNAMSEAYSHDPNNPELFPGEPMESLYTFTPHKICLLATDTEFRRQSEQSLAAMGLEGGLPTNLQLAISEFNEHALNPAHSNQPSLLSGPGIAGNASPDVPDASGTSTP